MMNKTNAGMTAASLLPAMAAKTQADEKPMDAALAPDALNGAARDSNTHPANPFVLLINLPLQ